MQKYIRIKGEIMNTIIFDLDGTLLPMDTKKFIKTYFHEMSLMFEGLIEPDKLIEYVMYSTQKMITNEEKRSNEEVFMASFKELVGDKFESCLNIFDDFYKGKYLKTKSLTSKNNEIIETVSILKEKGYNLVIATNPLFPREAIDHRINWAGLSVDDFSHVTCYEKNNFTKPNTKFYGEVLESIDKEPSDCIMVGNDIQDDMVASKLGIKTFLITDHLIDDEGSMEDIIIDHRGSYEDFKNFALSLPKINI